MLQGSYYTGMFRKYLSYNILLYLIVTVVLAAAVDWDKCLMQRGKYLLGIFYNGYFQNTKDGLIYQDYLKRHGMTDDEFRKGI